MHVIKEKCHLNYTMVFHHPGAARFEVKVQSENMIRNYIPRNTK